MFVVAWTIPEIIKMASVYSELKKSSFSALGSYDSFTISEISQTHIANCKIGNIAWEKVENV